MNGLNRNHHKKDCQTQSCNPLSGVYRFRGPAKIHSFNSFQTFHVFIVENGVEHSYTTFGGSPNGFYEREFSLCAEYRIKWCVHANPPDCNHIIPQFNKSCISVEAKPVLTCLKKKHTDDPSFYGWAYACGNCGDSEMSVHLYSSDGKTKLDPDDYSIVNCC